jgi:hypothetical protein
MSIYIWIGTLSLGVSIVGWIWIYFTIRRLMVANHYEVEIVAEIKEEIQSIKSALNDLK